MAPVNSYQLSQTYKNEYLTWRNDKDLLAAKHQEYLRRNPDAINDYDLQRTKILLNAVDMMDKSRTKQANNFGTAFETATSLGLGYAAIGGTTLGFLATKLGFVKKHINKIVKKHPQSKNIINMGITALSGVLGILATYPLYNSLSNIEGKIHQKRKLENIEKELNDPKIFVVLDEEQKKIFNENLAKIEKTRNKKNPTKIIKKELKTIKQLSKEALHYEKEQSKFKDKYKIDESLYDKQLSEKEIKNAKKDKVLLSILIKELNTKSQSYKEKIQKITDNLITISFALGSLFALSYERLAKKMKMKSSSIPAGLGVFLLISSTFFANWAQKRASHVGKFKAKQELMQNPEQLIYISKNKTNTIEDDEIKITPKEKTTTIKFLKEFFKHNKEYENWKKSSGFSGKNISEAMENIDITEEQLQDGKRLQQNLFKTLYKVEKNTQNYSNSIDVASESVKYPLNLILGTIGSVWGMKHLAKLRTATLPKEIINNSIKYISTILLFTIPSLFVNAYYAKAQKMGARISDMSTMKDLEDYRFFADYSKYKTQTSM